MKNAHRQLSLFRSAPFLKSGVAILIAFLLATHTLWCDLAGSDCDSDTAPSGFVVGATAHAPAAVSVVTHTHLDDDACGGMDESQLKVVAHAVLHAPPLVWVAVVFDDAAALGSVTLSQRVAVSGRDGPVRVPPLHSRLVRASLPHRAPPVRLI